jgi:predicted RNase H-like HicB family nuclease
MTLNDYESLPWTVHGRAVREGPSEAPYYLVTIEELPGFSVVAPSRTEAERLFPAVLREYLLAAVESGHPLPVPATV